MNLDDLLRRRLKQTAEQFVPPPDAWERIVNQADAQRRPRRSTLWAAAVVVLFGLVGIGLLVARDPDGDGGRLVTGQPASDEPSSSSTAPTPVPPASGPVASGPRPSAAPARLVGVSEDGRLIVVDSASGQEVLELAYRGDPAHVDVDGFRSFVSRASVSPDGRVLFATCCEPAVGNIYEVSVEGGEAHDVTGGSDAEVSPDGATIAAANAVVGILLLGQDAGAARIIEAMPGEIGEPIRVTWTPDGRRLVVETSRGVADSSRLFVVDASSTNLATAREFVPSAGAEWTGATPRPDGTFWVIERTDERPDVIRVLGGDGSPLASIDVGGAEILDLAGDVSGHWALVATTAGLLTISPEGTVASLPDAPILTSADW